MIMEGDTEKVFEAGRYTPEGDGQLDAYRVRQISGVYPVVMVGKTDVDTIDG